MALDEIALCGGHLAGLMQAVLETNARFRFKARGLSMTPFIRDKDVLTLAPAAGNSPAVGDVAAVIHPGSGAVIVHRIVGKRNGAFLLKGDRCHRPDGLFAASRIVGVVREVRRNGRLVRFGLGPEKRLAAFLSKTGLLNRLMLPVARRLWPVRLLQRGL